MAVIDMPVGGIASIAWKLPRHPTFAIRSTWTGKQQIVDLGATLGFTAEVTVAPRTLAQVRAWRAFFAALQGITNTFYLNASAGTTSSIVSVNGAGQTGSSINIDGLPASTTVKRAGDLIHIANAPSNKRMFVLTADLVSNGSGQATAQIEPPIIVAYADNSGVELNKPECHMRLINPETGWSHEPGNIFRPFSFQCEEQI